MRTRMIRSGALAVLAAAVCVLAGAAAARTLANPTITSIWPPKATAGQKVAIYGSGLSDTIAVQFNGIDANNLLENSAATAQHYEIGTAVPAPDTILEFHVQTANYDAGYGRG